MSKSREQAQKVIDLLIVGPVTREQLLKINPKYPSDPIYYAKSLFNLDIKRVKDKDGSTYVLQGKESLPEIVPVKEEIQPPVELKTEVKEISTTQNRKYIVPDWEGSSFQQWAKNFCSKHQWRVFKIVGDYQDCLAECALIWVECCRRYGAVVDNDAWMMRMYQICVVTTFDTKSVKDSNDKKLHQSLSLEEPSIESEAQLAVKLSSASSELRAVMRVFLNAPQEMLDVLRAEASSYHPMQFFKAVVGLCGISKAKSAALARELQSLLSNK